MIYLDHNASSPPSEMHLKKLFELLAKEMPANPSSPHALGRSASVMLSQARKNIATALDADVAEIIFTSGGTEANNLGTRGIVENYLYSNTNIDTVSIITSAFEHPCILKAFQYLKQTYPERIELIFIQPNIQGFIETKSILNAIKPNTILLSLMAANNEIGTVQPTKEIGDFLNFKRWNAIPKNLSSEEEFRNHQENLSAFLNPNISLTTLQNMHFHVDAVQIFGKIKSSEWMSLGYDSCAVSAHKLGAFQGTGALILRRGRRFNPLNIGGAQEKNRRAGTENLPGIMSFSLICEEMKHPSYWDKVSKMEVIRNQLFDELSKKSIIELNSQQSNSIPNTINFSFLENTFKAEDMILHLDMNGFYVSSGSACSSGLNLPSNVILALGKSKHLASNSIRISLGIENTYDDIEKFLNFFNNKTEK